MEEEVQDTMWPLPKFYFTVTFDSLEKAVVFQEVTGLDEETDTINYRHNQFSTIKMPSLLCGDGVATNPYGYRSVPGHFLPDVCRRIIGIEPPNTFLVYKEPGSS
ncbi:hypothetical protein [Cyclobacterium salsum]|uniref:hypothetical protein n=1 Tax=Cyclobacterium salsum TaxID=2666329 RepID=UPI00139093BA|nr:hypothetical protein [Cyclobacterium salsum]